MQNQGHPPTIANPSKRSQRHNGNTSKVQLGPLGHQFPNNRLALLVYAQSLLLTKRVVSSIAKRLGYQSGILKQRSQQFWFSCTQGTPMPLRAGDVQLSFHSSSTNSKVPKQSQAAPEDHGHPSANQCKFLGAELGRCG